MTPHQHQAVRQAREALEQIAKPGRGLDIVATDSERAVYWASATESCRSIARAALTALSTPVAWMHDDGERVCTAEDKKRMEGAGFGVWAENAKGYNKPLYATPTQPPAAAPAVMAEDIDDCDECEGTGRDPEFPETCACPVCGGTGRAAQSKEQQQ